MISAKTLQRVQMQNQVSAVVPRRHESPLKVCEPRARARGRETHRIVGSASLKALFGNFDPPESFPVSESKERLVLLVNASQEG